LLALRLSEDQRVPRQVDLINNKIQGALQQLQPEVHGPLMQRTIKSGTKPWHGQQQNQIS